ncbi:MAG: peptide-methionine (R)-S-oxide reductase MsrB [Moheibacter sp.]
MKTIIALGTILIFASCTNIQMKDSTKMENLTNKAFNIQKSEEQWKKELTPEQYHVLREAGTERPFSGQYNLHFEKGTYNCAACGESLFTSESKFDGHCGWPSFDQELEKGKILEQTDKSHGMVRTEILCGNCGSHLGHIFDDGPTETGLRYCVNSLSLGFEEDSVK